MNWLIVTLDMGIMLLAILPAISFYRKYRVVPVPEFQLFSLIFFCVVLSVAGELGAILWDITIFYQIQFLALISIYYIMYGYALRTHFVKTPKYLKLTMRIFYAFLILLILSWKKMIQSDRAEILIWDVKATHTAYFPKGAGVKIQGILFLSTSYYLLIDVFIAFCLLWYLFAIGSVKLIIKNNRVALARKLWIAVALINLTWVILVLPWTPSYEEANGLIVIQLSLIVYIIVKLPEGMIISNSQFFRSYDLIVEILKSEEHGLFREKLGFVSFVEYLEEVMTFLDNQSNHSEA